MYKDGYVTVIFAESDLLLCLSFRYSSLLNFYTDLFLMKPIVRLPFIVYLGIHLHRQICKITSVKCASLYAKHHDLYTLLEE